MNGRDVFVLTGYLGAATLIITGAAFAAPFWVPMIVGGALLLLLVLLVALTPAPTLPATQTSPAHTTPGSSPGSVRARVNPGSMTSV